MKIDITGSRCVSCAKFTQYYKRNWDGGMDAIDCGYCGQRGRRVRPGDRCKYYRECPSAAYRAAAGRKA